MTVVLRCQHSHDADGGVLASKEPGVCPTPSPTEQVRNEQGKARSHKGAGLFIQPSTDRGERTRRQIT